MVIKIPLFVAGPCSVESQSQISSIARSLKKQGFEYLRGGAYKPRTSPESFQGLGSKGLEYLRKAKEETGLKIVTELVSPEHIKEVSEFADVIQVGSRNMQNYELLKEIGRRVPKTPVLLKRGMQSTKEEIKGSINYLKSHGHKADLVFCERGIRTFSNGDYDRFTLDLSLVADLKKDKNFRYKVIVDPSHAAGRADIVENLALAGISAGADGWILEVKKKGAKPISDEKQAITTNHLKKVFERSKEIFGYNS